MRKFFTLLLPALGALLPFSACHREPAPPQTLFTLLDSATTGVTFTNTVTDEKERNILIYENYYNGAGVGLGDFNGDGLLDIYFGANLAGDRLYLNKGNLVFEDITAKAGIKPNGGWSSGVTVADVNADGRPDIYVCRDLYDDRPDLRTNQLYINNGDLTFTESAKAYGLNDSWRSRHATFLDYDRDGDLDCYLLNQPPNPGNFSEMLHVNTADTVYTARLYRNNGNQTFTDVSRQAGVVRAGYALGVGVADYNFDGWPDLYVANDFDAPDFFYVNNGDGTFTNRLESAVKHTSNSSMGVDVADVNNDGLHDIFVADMAAEDNARQKTNLGPMGPAQFRKVLGRGGYYQYMYNTLQVGNGNGTFSEVAQLAGVASTDWSWSPLLADFDNDGYKDLHVTNGFRRDIRDNDVTRTFPNYVHNLVEKTTAGRPNAGDINFWDVVNLPELLSLVPSEKLANYVFRNNGDLTFTPKMAEWGMDAKTFSNGSAYGDLDNDGDLDLVVSNIDEVAHIYRNNAEKVTGNRFLRVLLRIDPKVLPAFGAKVYAYYGGAQQFQETTNVRGFYSTSEPAVHFGLGRTEKVDRLVVRWPDGKESVLRDVQANQVVTISHADATLPQPAGETAAQPLFAADPGSGIRYRHVENDFDDFAEQGLLPHKLSTFGPGLAVADADGDGLEDFFVGGAAGSAGQLFRQHPDGTFSCTQTGPWLADKAAEDLDALFFDAEGDGDPDLYVVSGGGEFPAGSPLYQDRLYLNDGKGRFQKATGALPALPHSGSRVKAADFDGDGDLDLFVGGRLAPGEYPKPGRSLLLQNDGGRFTDVTNTLAPGLADAGMVTDAAWSDFDRDGKPDLVVVGEWMPVTFFRNEGGRFADVTDRAGTRDGTGWWFSIEAADFDGDGDDDYVAGNLGRNYRYQATAAEPFHAYYADFDGNGSGDIVLGYHHRGTLYPVEDLKWSAEQVPALRKQFETHKAFSRASLAEVYGESQLAGALHRQARTFASTYFRNNGNGTFAAVPLPLPAQRAPVNGILSGDFDADGQRDLVLAGNLYATEVKTPRADAGVGLFLKGDGKGNFAPVPLPRSGLYAPLDAKDLALVQTTRGKRILVANNNDSLGVIRVLRGRQGSRVAVSSHEQRSPDQ